MFSQPIYTTAQIRQLEHAALAQDPHCALMERAGLAAADYARELLGEAGTDVLVICGAGNNGGDALVAARHLKQWWYRVTVVLAGDAAKLPVDAARALQQFQAAGGETLPDVPAHGTWSLVVDGLFGIGLTRELSGHPLQLIQRINALDAPVLALDIPSGLDADTGNVHGAAIQADHTITFIALKPGLLTADGLDYCGRIRCAKLNLDAARLLPPTGWLLDETVAKFMPRRRANSHKGLFGSVGIIGGAHGMLGAAVLAARAALKLGAGRVYLGALSPMAPAVDLEQPELMWHSPHQVLELDLLDVLVTGPGIGQSAAANALLTTAVQAYRPLVLDADALNLLAHNPNIQAALLNRTAATILTPHPAEAARLLGCSTMDVQHDRLTATLELARQFNSAVVLKGAGSMCALADGRWVINPSGNPGMSSAGMGDVLSGMLGALLGQGLEAEQAALLAVYLHGAAADACVANGIGPVGLTASEVIDSARGLINRWVYAARRHHCG